MGDVSLYFVLCAALSFCIGALLGRGASRSSVEKEVGIAVERAKTETEERVRSVVEAEKQELSQELGQQFSQIRQGIIQSAVAYERAVQSVGKKLSVPVENPDKTIDIEVNRQLKLDFPDNGTAAESDEADQPPTAS